jgi:hypothetical protein
MLHLMIMNSHASAAGCILAVLGLAGGCARSTRPPADAHGQAPDAEFVTPRPDALPTHPSSSSCLTSAEVIDIGPPPRPVNLEIGGCLWHTLDTGRALAVFWWSNRTGQVQAAPYGPTNQVSPGADAQGQPASFFVPGGDKFAVPFQGTPETWTILGQSVTVSQDSEDCGSTCSFYEQYLCLDCGGHLWDLCTVACGDGVCDAGETCSTCPADCDCSGLVPLVDCMLPAADGKKLVSFGYRNDAAVGAGVDVGPDNQLLAGQASRGQPTHFEVGVHHSVFQISYGGPEVPWMLAGTTVAATAGTPLCSQGCASECPRGAVCVAGQCQTSCGDDLCAAEGCADCPDDCACPGDMICLGTSCGNPPRCGGVGPQCGVIEQFGVSADCGPCPDGQGCNALHLCDPLCSVDAGM